MFRCYRTRRSGFVGPTSQSQRSAGVDGHCGVASDGLRHCRRDSFRFYINLPVSPETIALAHYLSGFDLILAAGASALSEIPRLHLDPIDMEIGDQDVSRLAAERVARVRASARLRLVAAPPRHRKRPITVPDTRKLGRQISEPMRDQMHHLPFPLDTAMDARANDCGVPPTPSQIGSDACSGRGRMA